MASVSAIIDEQIEVSLQYGVAQTQVCQNWLGYSNCQESGFQEIIDVSNIHHDPICAHQIEIRAQDEDGNERIIANSFICNKRQQPKDNT